MAYHEALVVVHGGEPFAAVVLKFMELASDPHALGSDERGIEIRARYLARLGEVQDILARACA